MKFEAERRAPTAGATVLERRDEQQRPPADLRAAARFHG